MEMAAGSSAYISRDIVIENQYAFKEGEQVVIESITQNLQRPQYRYVVFSSILNKRFQLCETDLTVMQKPVQLAALDLGSARHLHTRPITKPCPYCKELILADAIMCNHCGSNIDTDSTTKGPKQRFRPYAIASGVLESTATFSYSH